MYRLCYMSLTLSWIRRALKIRRLTPINFDDEDHLRMTDLSSHQYLWKITFWTLVIQSCIVDMILDPALELSIVATSTHSDNSGSIESQLLYSWLSWTPSFRICVPEQTTWDLIFPFIFVGTFFFFSTSSSNRSSCFSVNELHRILIVQRFLYFIIVVSIIFVV